VGASNELPESEELDALYDRFLVRRQVKQVSPSGGWVGVRGGGGREW
jgi:MoxR-like ATPase